MNNEALDKDGLEVEKLQNEIKNLKADLETKRHATWRWNLSAASIVAGILLTIVQIQGAYKEIKNKEVQLALEAKARTEESIARSQEYLIRSHQIFVSEILERVDGIKGLKCIPKEGLGKSCGSIAGYLVSEYDMYSVTTQDATFRLAINLMDEFDSLCEAGLPLLSTQDKFGIHLTDYLRQSKCYKSN